MNNIDRRLQPGEKILCRMQRKRDWRHLIKILVLDYLILLSVVFLVRYLERTMAISYLTQSAFVGQGGFMAGTLLVGLLPALMVLALAQDFAYTFIIEVALTNRRIVGWVSGPLWARWLDLPLGEVRAVQSRPLGYTVIQCSQGRPDVFLAGFERQEGLADAYRRFAFARRVEPASEPLHFIHAG